MITDWLKIAALAEICCPLRPRNIVYHAYAPADPSFKLNKGFQRAEKLKNHKNMFMKILLIPH